MGLRAAASLAFVVISATVAGADARALSDAQIKKLIIAESIASYQGTCACPYSTARNGTRCGGRSAYNRAGGYAPLCYVEDVTQKQVDDYRDRHGIEKA